MKATAFLDPVHELRIEACEGGVLIQQAGQCYVARRFKLTKEFCAFVRTAIAMGFTKLWQFGNPMGRESSRITFSSTHAPRSWVFALGLESLPPRLERVILPRHFRLALKHAPFEWAQKAHGQREILIEPTDLKTAVYLITRMTSSGDRIE